VPSSEYTKRHDDASYAGEHADNAEGWSLSTPKGSTVLSDESDWERTGEVSKDTDPDLGGLARTGRVSLVARSESRCPR